MAQQCDNKNNLNQSDGKEILCDNPISLDEIEDGLWLGESIVSHWHCIYDSFNENREKLARDFFLRPCSLSVLSILLLDTI